MSEEKKKFGLIVLIMLVISVSFGIIFVENSNYEYFNRGEKRGYTEIAKNCAMEESLVEAKTTIEGCKIIVRPQKNNSCVVTIKNESACVDIYERDWKR